MEEKQRNKVGYYSVIPSKILYNKELKANEKLLYAMITSLACKEGYCFADVRIDIWTHFMRECIINYVH